MNGKRIVLILAALLTFGCNGILLTPVPNSPNALGAGLQMELGELGTPEPRWETMIVCNVKAELGLNLRAEAGTGAEVLEVVPSGTEVETLGNSVMKSGGKWTGGRVGKISGWVNARYLCRP